MTDNGNGAFGAVSFSLFYLDEIRLKNILLDKVKVVCYTLVTVKKDLIKERKQYYEYFCFLHQRDFFSLL